MRLCFPQASGYRQACKLCSIYVHLWLKSERTDWIKMGYCRARHCSFYRRWRRGFAFRGGFHVAGKGRETSSPISGRAGLGKMGFWPGTGALRCRARYRERTIQRRFARRQRTRRICKRPGRDGTTLLNFAVRQSWQRPGISRGD